MTKIGLISLGCSKNLVDSENLLGFLKADGYELTPDAAQAEIIIVNTCGFIDSAKQESIDTVIEMAKYKQNNCKALVMIGCLVQRYQAELEKELPEVNVFMGVSDYSDLPDVLDELMGKNKCESNFERVLTTPSHYAYLKIADGCDNRCTYCAIPLIRGGFVSVPFEDIIAQAKGLVARGVKELNVIAQDITRYGLDIYGKRMLAELLVELCKTDVSWIRLLYTYPEDIDDELLDVIQANDKIVKYIDMPLQHVDDDILLAMNRRGGYNAIKNLVENIRARDKQFVLRTTFITGFPGESTEQFNTLENFMLRYPFERAGVFAYSQEDQTPAASFPKQIETQVKKRRVDALMKAQQKISMAFNAQRVGTLTPVLTDGFDSTNGMYFGRSYAEAPDIDGLIYFKAPYVVKPGDFVIVKIIRALEYDLIGEALK